MTGLDPARNVIVEIATIITDDELNIVAEGPDLVIGATPQQLGNMDDVVRRMHTTSGLLTAIGKSTVTVDYAATATLEFIKSHVPTAGSVPLCGNSIAMDRRFLRHYMPALDEYFHYRTIDVSTLKELCKRWYRDLYSARPQKVTAHRRARRHPRERRRTDLTTASSSSARRLSSPRRHRPDRQHRGRGFPHRGAVVIRRRCHPTGPCCSVFRTTGPRAAFFS